MRPASKARGVEHTGVFERRVTPLAGMQRRPKAKLLRGSPLGLAKVERHARLRGSLVIGTLRSPG
jgi:hypothetical protein